MDAAVGMCMAIALFGWVMFIIFGIYIIEKDLRKKDIAQKLAGDFVDNLDIEEFKKDPAKRKTFLDHFADKIVEDASFRAFLAIAAAKKKEEDTYNKN